jgi:hypothetical protein
MVGEVADDERVVARNLVDVLAAFAVADLPFEKIGDHFDLSCESERVFHAF